MLSGSSIVLCTSVLMSRLYKWSSFWSSKVTNCREQGGCRSAIIWSLGLDTLYPLPLCHSLRWLPPWTYSSHQPELQSFPLPKHSFVQWEATSRIRFVVPLLMDTSNSGFTNARWFLAGAFVKIEYFYLTLMTKQTFRQIYLNQNRQK